LNPLKDIIGHNKLDPTRRTDPMNAFSRINKTWEDFIKDISVAENPKSAIIRKVDELKKLIEQL
jgi:N-acetyl-anhydromuramyl-L-alanine amidase AmpD